ncbi:MAG TPA: U32 family peptidase [Bacteriovoracaceae bacterium]|nr:U32 family peptidase [Bacteriovoracaceae bacterium]
MKYISYGTSKHDLGLLKEANHDEVIFGHRDFSRFGKLDDEKLAELLQEAQKLNMRTVFEWDILMTENVFSELKEKIVPWLDQFDVLRVQDPGALEWALKNTNRPLQFIAENANRNLEALQGWCDYIGERLDRLVLSIELSKTTLEEFLSKLKVPCELLGLGRILLFYTPRNLLSALNNGDKISYNEEISALGESEESPHKGFPIVENKHGTFMFHIKEFCLLEYRDELAKMGLSHMRIDLRWEGLHYLRDLDNLKEVYPQDLMRGFFLVNKTDVLFPKLKNSRLQKREGNYLGEVIEVEKSKHLALLVKHPQGIRPGMKVKIVHPKGEEFEVTIHWLKDASLKEVDFMSQHRLALIPYVGGVWVKSHLFIQ